MAAGKPTGGPAIVNVTVYSGGSFTCPNQGATIPNDGSAGTPASYSVAENGCSIMIPPMNANSVYKIQLTQAPKTGTVGCWLQLYEEGGCGFTLTNGFFGQPIPGLTAGTTLPCVTPPVGLSSTFGAIGIFCA
jgi:hypothetical protein